jgi:hypothetical protein
MVFSDEKTLSVGWIEKLTSLYWGGEPSPSAHQTPSWERNTIASTHSAKVTVFDSYNIPTVLKASGSS